MTSTPAAPIHHHRRAMTCWSQLRSLMPGMTTRAAPCNRPHCCKTRYPNQNRCLTLGFPNSWRPGSKTPSSSKPPPHAFCGQRPVESLEPSRFHWSYRGRRRYLWSQMRLNALPPIHHRPRNRHIHLGARFVQDRGGTPCTTHRCHWNLPAKNTSPSPWTHHHRWTALNATDGAVPKSSAEMQCAPAMRD